MQDDSLYRRCRDCGSFVDAGVTLPQLAKTAAVRHKLLGACIDALRFLEFHGDEFDPKMHEVRLSLKAAAEEAAS